VIDGTSILVTVIGEWEGVEFKTIQVSRVRVNIYMRSDLGRKGDRGRVNTNRWVDE
jgi:hypothetical protein